MRWTRLAGLLFASALFSIAAFHAASASVCFIPNGCTGTSTAPGNGKVPIGDANGNYEFVSGSSLGPISSVFGRTGAVTAQTGDYTTSQVTEGSNLYYTLLRWASALAGTTTDALREGTSNLYFTTARAITALTGQNISIFTNNAGYLTGNQTITLSGDVSGSGATAINATIGNNAVTYAKFQQVASNSLVGNPTGAASNAQAIATSGLKLAISDTTGTLAVSRGGTGSTSRGAVLAGGGNSVYSTATWTPSAGAGISLSGSGSVLGALTITNAGVISNSCPGGFLSCSGTNPSTFTLGTLGVGNGGTGSTSLGALLAGGGASAYSVATTAPSAGTGISLSGNG